MIYPRFPFWSLIATVWLIGCAKPPPPPSPFLNAIGITGVSSPTAQASGSFATGFLLLPSSSSTLPDLPLRMRAQAGTSSIASLASVKGSLQSVLAQTDPDECLAGAFSFAAPSLSVSTCYGPILNYQNDPDAVDGANCSGSSYPCFTYGQVGVWSTAESTGEACSAANVNSTIQASADVVNSALRAIASLLCVSKGINATAPVVGGAPLNLVGALNEFVSGADFSEASISQLPARTATVQTWETRIVGTLNGQTIDLDLVHSPTVADNSTFAGHFFGLIGDGTTNFAFSLTYQQTAAALVTLTKFGLPTAVTSAPFDVANDLDFGNALLSGQPVYYILSQLNPTTGIGTTYAAWMNSNQDAYSRQWQVTTSAGLSSDTGVAYFGFGNQLTNSTDRGLIKKMICNWGGPGANNAGISAKAESQHLVRGTNGVFTADQNAITFAPTNSCAYNPGTFALSVSPAAPVALGVITPQFANFNSTTGVGDYGNIPILTEPTY